MKEEAMPILIDNSSRVLFYGDVSSKSLFQVQEWLAYGTRMMGWVDSEKAGSSLLSLPVFATCKEAKRRTHCNTVALFLPPFKVGEAIIEAEEAGIELIMCCTNEVPLHDLSEALSLVRERMRSRLLGPGSVGVLSPGQCKVGSMPAFLHQPGRCGIVSPTATLMYEAALQTSQVGLGQSTTVHIGDSLLSGMDLFHVLSLFNRDPETEVILVLGPLQESIDSLEEWTMTSAHKPIALYVPSRPKVRLRKYSRLYVIEDPTHIGEGVQQAIVAWKLYSAPL